MKYALRPHFKSMLLAATVVFLISGCVYIVEHSVKKSYPTFKETADSWPEINEGKGRVVFYYGKQPISPTSPTNTISFFIDKNKKERAVLMDEMFLFNDLSSGPHSIEIECRNLYTFNIKVDPGRVHYIKLFREENSEHCISYLEMKKDEAQIELETMNHFFNNSKSLHYQYNPS